MAFSFACKTFWLISLVFSATVFLYSESKELVRYTKVDPRFPDDLGNHCFLTSHTNNVRIDQCANRCSEHLECHLFCIKGKECSLYKAFVGSHWKGIVGEPLPSAECFSSWGQSNDAMLNATFSHPTLHSPLYTAPEMLAKGYTCNDETGTIYATKDLLKPWWVADLGTVHKITSIRIVTRQNLAWPSYFANVEIRVGTSNPGNGDFSANPLLAFYKGPAPYNTVLTFPAVRPLKGSVVSIQTVSSAVTFLIFSDVQLLFS